MNSGLSIIIPILNEEDILEANATRLVRYLEGFQHPFEVILVSNGSTDRTDAIGARLAQRHESVRFFALPQKGVGHAFSLGVREAAFPIIVSVDMDLSIDLGLIPRAVEFLEDYHIVVGSKKMGSQARSLWRRFGSSAFILAARIMLGLSFEDYSIAAKAYRRDTILKYLNRIDHGTSYVLDIIFLTLNDGGCAIEVPVYCEDFRPSKFNLFREAVYRFGNLFKLWWEYRVMK